ncbi:restriction endonuclease subunit S [Streptomyces pseudogriseolus]|uniref:restriction endonuclease subunit S n=1 Tax=Streptomyces pseudogriseolus TaxID=36817 RepID=UPI003FA2880E
MTWKETRLKHLCIDSGQYGLNIAAENYSATGTRLIRTSDITADGSLKDVESAVHVDVSIEPRHQLLPGDILLSRSGTLGRSFIVPSQAQGHTFAGFLIRFRPKPEVEPRFLYYATQSARFQGTVHAEAVTSTIQNFNADRYANIPMSAPAKEEQRRIADFLDAETTRIDTLSAMRRKMRELLALKRERVIESTLGLERDNSPHALIPLKYMVEAVSVGIVITPARWYVDSGGTPALRGINVKPGAINSGDLVQISTQGHAEHAKSRLQAGDVVVVRTGQAGAAAVVPPEFDGANCIDLIIVRPGPKVAPKYLEYVLNSEHARAQVSEHAVGSIQAHFNVGAMKQIPLPSVPRSEQEETVTRLDQAVGRIDRLQGKLVMQEQLLAERRLALITAAVTGQFDVSTASGRNVTEGVSA